MVSSINKLLIIIKRVSLIKTLYYNLKLLPLNQAIKFPLLIGRNTVVRSMSGKVNIIGPVSPGMISFGVILIFRDNPNNKSYLSLRGEITFKGHAIFRSGCNINVEPCATLEVGENFEIGADSIVYARKKILFGTNCSISWNTQIIDTDFHYIKDMNNNYPNNTIPIIIGDNVWICNHVSISKGVILQNGTIVSANSLVNKSFDKENCIIGGTPARILKEGYRREYNLAVENKLRSQI